LKEPYTKQMKGKLRELRITEKGGSVRIFYFSVNGKKFVLLHGFIKKTAKTPVREIEIAQKRMEDFVERYGG
jgi:phage-related protein